MFADMATVSYYGSSSHILRFCAYEVALGFGRYDTKKGLRR